MKTFWQGESNHRESRPVSAASITAASMDKPDRHPAPVKAAPFLLAALYALPAIAVLGHSAMPAPVVAVSMLLGAALIALSVTDLAAMRLPDAITLPLILAGPLIALGFGWGDLSWRIASAAIGLLALVAIGCCHRALRGGDGLGLRHAKLFAAAGAWLGLEALPSVMLWACCVGLFGVLAAMLLRRPWRAAARIPFGPFLAFGFWMVWLYGPL